MCMISLYYPMFCHAERSAVKSKNPTRHAKSFEAS